MIEFAHPHWLWLLLLLAPLIAWYVYSRRHHADPSVRMSTTRAFDGIGTSWRQWMQHVVFALKLAALACLIVIIARPQTRTSWADGEVEGTDIVIAFDVSTSMLARDFRPNRFEAAKQVAINFVSGRENDNIGLVIFAGESFTQVPMTMDKSMLVNAIKQTHMEVLEDGTAIGDGIATAINRIRDGKAKSKSIILLTDGSNNTGMVAPNTAAEIAQKYGIKIYTIGVGSNGKAEYPVAINYDGSYQYRSMDVVIDEATLRQIAQTTGGKYFRATGNETLRQIFDEIDKLEKTRLDVQHFSRVNDNFMPWAVALLLLLLAALLLDYTVLRHTP